MKKKTLGWIIFLIWLTWSNKRDIKKAFLVDIYDSPIDVRNALLDCEELNGDPFYLRWRIGKTTHNPILQENRLKVDDFLKSCGLTVHDIIIITGGR